VGSIVGLVHIGKKNERTDHISSISGISYMCCVCSVGKPSFSNASANEYVPVRPDKYIIQEERRQNIAARQITISRY